jgi:hypothetical protein
MGALRRAQYSDNLYFKISFMRPLHEQVHVPLDSSFALLWRGLPEIPFEWHYHPEYELTLTLTAQG